MVDLSRWSEFRLEDLGEVSQSPEKGNSPDVLPGQFRDSEQA